MVYLTIEGATDSRTGSRASDGRGRNWWDATARRRADFDEYLLSDPRHVDLTVTLLTGINGRVEVMHVLPIGLSIIGLSFGCGSTNWLAYLAFFCAYLMWREQKTLKARGTFFEDALFRTSVVPGNLLEVADTRRREIEAVAAADRAAEEKARKAAEDAKEAADIEAERDASIKPRYDPYGAG